MTRRYYHFYTIPKTSNQKSRLRNVEPATSAVEARTRRDWYNAMNLPTGVVISQYRVAPVELDNNAKIFK